MENVFFAHSVNVIGGAERVTLAIIRDIKSECQPVMIAPQGKDLGDTAKQYGAIFEPTEVSQPEKFKPLNSLKQLWQYYRIFKRHKPKLVHTGDLLALRSLQPICKLLNIPMVCHVHFPYEIPFMRWALKNTYAPHSFIFCSHELKGYLHSELSNLCPTSEMHVIHNGVDINIFKPLEDNRNPIPRIGIIANLQYRKGHDDFLDMAKLLIEKGVEAQFDIIGGDILQEPRAPYLKQKAQELGISEHVTFHGQLPNVKAELQKLDIVVCASHEEAFPISMLEAMACGKAIVSTNVNGIPEAITDKETGLLVEAHSPSLLAEATFKVLKDAALANTLQLNSRKRVVEFFSSAVYASKIKEVYKNISA